MKVIWLWCLGFMLVWILNMKLVNFFLFVLIICLVVWWGIGDGVYWVRLFSIWLILKLFSVVLKNIGVSLFCRNNLWLNLCDVLSINFNFLCSCVVKLVLIVWFSLGLFKFLIMCFFWMVWFWFEVYKMVLLWWMW